MPVTITRRVCGRRTHLTVYTQAEARAAGIVCVPWQEAEAGAWALTDDGFVAECLGRRMYEERPGGSRTHLTFSFARAWLPRTRALAFGPFRVTGHYGGTRPEAWTATESRKERTWRVVRAFVDMLLSKKEVNWIQPGQIYRPDQKVPEATVRRLFKQEVVRHMVREELRKTFQGEGHRRSGGPEDVQEGLPHGRAGREPLRHACGG